MPWIRDYVKTIIGYSQPLSVAAGTIEPKHIEELAQMLSGLYNAEWKQLSPRTQIHYRKAARTMILGWPRFIELFKKWEQRG